MGHFPGLAELGSTAGYYIDQYNLVVAGGPLAASAVVRVFVGRNRAMSLAMGASTAWLGVKELSAPLLNLMQDQFGHLHSLSTSVR